MKKIMTLVALAAMMMGVASCSDDGPVREDKLSYGVTDLMTKTVTGDTYFDYAGSKLRFDLNYLADTACLRVLDTKFAERQQTALDEGLESVAYTEYQSAALYETVDSCGNLLIGEYAGNELA